METVSRQEILAAYLCVIGTVALVLWLSRAVRERVLERDDCGPPRGGRALPEQPAPPPRAKRAPAPYSHDAPVRGALLMRDLRAPEARAAHGMRGYEKSAFNRSARDMWADIPNGELPLAEARAAHGMRERAFCRSAPISIGMGNASARRGANARGASLVQSAPSLWEPSGLTPGGMGGERPFSVGAERAHPGGMGGEQRAGRPASASSARMRANAREAPATPGAPALPPCSSQWRLDNERGVRALEGCLDSERGASALEERCEQEK
jgi:hypothetical protein